MVSAGDQYTLQCNIRRKTRAPSNTILRMVWLDRDGDVITSGSAYAVSGMSNTTSADLTSTLTFHRLTTSQGGLYSCTVNATIPGTVKDEQIISTFPVRVASESSDWLAA